MAIESFAFSSPLISFLLKEIALNSKPQAVQNVLTLFKEENHDEQRRNLRLQIANMTNLTQLRNQSIASSSSPTIFGKVQKPIARIAAQ